MSGFQQKISKCAKGQEKKKQNKHSKSVPHEDITNVGIVTQGS